MKTLPILVTIVFLLMCGTANAAPIDPADQATSTYPWKPPTHRELGPVCKDVPLPADMSKCQTWAQEEAPLSPEEIAGYNVYHGTDTDGDGICQQEELIHNTTVTIPQYTIDNVANRGLIVCFRVTVFDTNERESLMADMVTHKILPLVLEKAAPKKVEMLPLIPGEPLFDAPATIADQPVGDAPAQ